MHGHGPRVRQPVGQACRCCSARSLVMMMKRSVAGRLGRAGPLLQGVGFGDLEYTRIECAEEVMARGGKRAELSPYEHERELMYYPDERKKKMCVQCVHMRSPSKHMYSPWRRGLGSTGRNASRVGEFRRFRRWCLERARCCHCSPPR